MTDYLSALRRRMETHPLNLGDADSVLTMLYEAYSDCNPMVDAPIFAVILLRIDPPHIAVHESGMVAPFGAGHPFVNGGFQNRIPVHYKP